MKIFKEITPFVNMIKVVFLITPGHIKEKSCGKKYWIRADLSYPTHYNCQALQQVISIFSLLYELNVMTNIFLKSIRLKRF